MSNRIVTGIASLMLAAFVVGCDENEGPTESIQVRPLTTTPVSAGVIEGSTQTFTARDAAGAPAQVQWETGNTAIATVNASGVVTAVSAGVTHVTARLASDASVLSSSTVTVIAVPSLTSGTPVTNVSSTGARFSFRYWKIVVPAGRTSLTVTTTGGGGDADLFVLFNAVPTASQSGTANTATRCSSEEGGNTESCVIANPAAGTWYIGLMVWNAYSGLTLTARTAP